MRQSRADRFFQLLDYRMLVPVLALVIIGLAVLNTVLAKGYGAVIFDYPMNFYKQIAAVLIGLVAAFTLCLFEPDDAPDRGDHLHHEHHFAHCRRSTAIGLSRARTAG